MTITHYYPWGRPQLADNEVRNEVRNFFSRFFDENEAPAVWSPRVDVREEQDRYVILADLPGIDPKEIDISADRNVLTVKGERRAENVTENARLTRIERSYGSFERSFTLPESADTNAIKATGKNGVLEIAIPKKPEAAPRKIEIAH
jgi:HSP20 family protein